MLGPVSNEDQVAGSGTGCVRALSPVTCVRAGADARVCGIVSAVRVRGLCWGGPPQLHEVWVRLLDVVEGAEEASLDAVVTRQARAFASRIHKCSNCCIFKLICKHSSFHYMYIQNPH